MQKETTEIRKETDSLGKVAGFSTFTPAPLSSFGCWIGSSRFRNLIVGKP